MDFQGTFKINSTSQAEVMNNPDVEHVNAQLPSAYPWLKVVKLPICGSFVCVLI